MASDALAYGIGSDIWPGLAKLVEEMGELQELLGKVMASAGPAGTASATYWDGTNLRPRLIEEMGDVRAAIAFFAEANGFRSQDINDRADTKLGKFYYWHEEYSNG